MVQSYLIRIAIYVFALMKEGEESMLEKNSQWKRKERKEITKRGKIKKRN